MAAAAPGADFKLLLNAINREQRPAIIQELMLLLQIDQKTAASATENVPIVLVGGMTQQQALTLRTHIPRLLRLGCDLKLTAEPVGKVKQLRWQAPPAATRIPGNLLVCPSCGDRFIVQRWQPQPAAAQPQAEEQAQPPAAPAAPAAAAQAAEEEPVEAEPLEAEPVEAEAVEADPAEEIQEAVPAEEVAEAQEAGEVEEAAPAAEQPGQVEPLGEEDDLLGAFAEEVEAAADEPEPVEAEPAPKPPPQPAKPAQPEPAPEPEAAPQAAAPPEPEAPPEPAPAASAPQPAAPAAEEAEAAESEDAGPRYDVSVAKVRGEKQEKLAEYLAQRQGITFEEAMKLCEKTVVVVCRGGTSAEADECRRALIKMGIKPRIRKRSG
jgi:hypothetical protein